MINFNVAEYGNFTDMMSDSTSQLPFNKQLSSFNTVTKNTHQYLRKPASIFLSFPIMYLCKKEFFSYIQITEIHCNILYAEANISFY